MQVVKVLEPSLRDEVLEVIQEVYIQEKNWVKDPQQEIEKNLKGNDRVSWFLARYEGVPVGALRLFYDPPLQMPDEFEVTLNSDIDVEKLAGEGRFVDIGRFMIMPRYRSKLIIAIRLMKSAIQEVVERDYTHFITDVFEGEATSPLNFHRRVLGFEVIGKHLYGELNCRCTRIILTLDILKAYQRIKTRKNAFYDVLTEGISGILDRKLELRMKKGKSGF
ncbi:MAG: GNAT family N-acetyltransferase [Candidatus Aegiribacteria sp.]|nr:GNAT family N-acetyltransferase [Candidatus Aegiribacteria sp.]MBD3294735.1 GNAT family N-acetyltransferase [Candidatus Fermentibacteria bacterium]